ncbi:hypothetical protein A5782_05960 [Mycobacterium sp. 852002-40037_SCH5390672]|nr:hypothetical protein A5782_05960 [Mycobacterium sp. 852002-40037_SCH5390672]
MHTLGFYKYDDYFKKTFNLMPDDGLILLHVIPSELVRPLPIHLCEGMVSADGVALSSMSSNRGTTWRRL